MPKRVLVGALDYSIEPVPEIKGGQYIGQHLPVDKKIVILSDMDDKSKLNVLLHELCHAIFYERNLSEHVDKKSEEHIVDQIGNAIHALLANNKELRRYIDAVCES